MTEHEFNNVSSINIERGANGFRVVLSTPDEQKPDPTDTVTSLKELNAALYDGAADITVSGEFIVGADNPIIIPRNVSPRSIRGKATFAGNGQDFRIISSPGRGGELRLFDFTVDGGWRINPGECPDDRAANLYLPSFETLELNGIKTQYSRRTGIFAPNTRRLNLRKCEGYALPRDFIWANGTQNFLAEDCKITYCCDDGIGCHLSLGESGENREVVIRRNTLLSTLGIKVLGGGKNVLIEDNTITAAGFYGVRLGIDPTTGEGSGDQQNITVRNNIIENVLKTTRCHPGQVQGVWIFMYAPRQQIANISYVGNTLIRNSSADGETLKSLYPWAKEGVFTKPRFDPYGIVDIGDESIRTICVNPNDMQITGNTFRGF